MTWKEFQKNINTREKYLAFVKKNLKMAPIPAEYKGKVDAAIDSIDKETYEKEFERIGNNYSKIVVREASRNSANRKGKSRGGRKKKRRKTKKIQKGGVGIGAIVLYITLGGIALCFIGNCIIECGCSRPCGILPSDERGDQERRQARIEYNEKEGKWYKARKGRHISENIEKHTKINKGQGRRGKSPVRVKSHSANYDKGSVYNPDVDIELSYINQHKDPTLEEEEAMENAKQYAKDFQFYNQTDDGHSSAAYLQEMRKKYPDMTRRTPSGVKVLTGEENKRDKWETERDNANLGGHVGGPFSGIFRRD